MTHKEIYGCVKPGTTLYSVSLGRLLKYQYQLTEVHTQYDGSRTYYSVMTDEAGITWSDHSAYEWFLTKEEAVKWGIKREEQIIKEHTINLNKYKKML